MMVTTIINIGFTHARMPSMMPSKPPKKKGGGGGPPSPPKMVTRSGKVDLHPCSVNFTNTELGRFGLNRLMTFHEKVKTSKVYVSSHIVTYPVVNMHVGNNYEKVKKSKVYVSSHHECLMSYMRRSLCTPCPLYVLCTHVE